jgi:hypothetical protein
VFSKVPLIGQNLLADNGIKSKPYASEKQMNEKHVTEQGVAFWSD